jgi:hypothetical protein
MQSVWKDQTCGDGVCDYPFEYKGYAHLGCVSDCGRETNLMAVVVVLTANFEKSSQGVSLGRTLKDLVRWNLCLSNPARTEAGLENECWYVESSSVMTNAPRTIPWASLGSVGWANQNNCVRACTVNVQRAMMQRALCSKRNRRSAVARTWVKTTPRCH